MEVQIWCAFCFGLLLGFAMAILGVSFVTRTVRKAVNIDDYIDAWHEAETDLELHEWLGMSIDEYKIWLESAGDTPPPPNTAEHKPNVTYVAKSYRHALNHLKSSN